MSLFTPYIIVYSKHRSRYQNYLKVKKIIKNVQYFEAIDTITDDKWEEWKLKSIKELYTTNRYLKSIGNYRGKLGCNLSHQVLLKNFLKDGVTNWLLVMEDDITLNGYDENKINKILHHADSIGSKFIQLYTHPKFNKVQFNDNNLSDPKTKLFKMLPQWGTVAYLIHVEAISSIINSYPIETNMDYVYNSNINNFNSLCLYERMFFTAGNLDGDGNNGKMGSLIWDYNSIKQKVKVNNNKLPFIKNIDTKIIIVPNTYNFLDDIPTCNYTYLPTKEYSIDELKDSITYFVNPFIRLLLTFNYWKKNNLHKSEIPDNVDNKKLFLSFINFCYSNKITNEHLELQSNHIKKGKIYSKIIRIENFEEDLNKITSIQQKDDYIKKDTYKLFEWIRYRILVFWPRSIRGLRANC